MKLNEANSSFDAEIYVCIIRTAILGFIFRSAKM